MLSGYRNVAGLLGYRVQPICVVVHTIYVTPTELITMKLSSKYQNFFLSTETMLNGHYKNDTRIYIYYAYKVYSKNNKGNLTII